MHEHAAALADAVEAALPGWVERSVARVLAAAGRPFDGEVAAAAVAAGRAAAAEVGPRLRELLATDIDDQRTTPLALVRAAVRHPAAVLRDAGVAPVRRDGVQAGLFPDDDYDLTPATLADVDPGLGDLGLAWGAWKAMAHKARHGAPR